MIKMRKAILLSLLVLFLASFVVADPPSRSSPPPDNTQSWHYGYEPIKGCFEDFDRSTDTLEYCSEPYVNVKTKEITCCDPKGTGADPDNQRCGTWENPRAVNRCRGICRNCYSTYEARKNFTVCGKVDGEKNPDAFPQTMTADDDKWACPTIKALSIRNKPGDISPGFGLAGSGYSDLDKIIFRSDGNMSYYMQATIPACVNRIPMMKLDVQMKNQEGEIASKKSGIFASHQNLYYGPNGDSGGVLKEVKLPEQEAFKKRYNPQAELKSYRMWAWRKRFSGAVKRVIDQKNLELPKDVNVDNIAEDHLGTGKSVGDLWLSPDFLFGKEAGDTASSSVDVRINKNSTCDVDVRKISEHDFSTVEDLQDYVEDNPEESNELLGKEGGNYCDIGDKEELTNIWEVKDSGAVLTDYREETGTISTKLFRNVTESIDATVDVTRIDTEEDISDAGDFVDYHDSQPEEAEEDLNENKDIISSGSDLSIHTIKEASSVTEKTTSNVSLTLDTSRWMFGSEYAALSKSEAYNQIDNAALNDRNQVECCIEPLQSFEDWMILNKSRLLDYREEGRFEAEIEARLSKDTEDYYAFIDIGVVTEESTERSWNWRALEELSLTELSRCMYNWEECFGNKHNIGKSWQASEVYDAGSGPWTGSNTFEWSATQAFPQAKEELESEYGVETDVTFDKRFDGARGSDSAEPTDVNVYRKCENREGWVSEEGNFYPDAHFLCQNNSQTIQRCGSKPSSNMPNTVEFAREHDTYLVNGDYYACRISSPGQWVIDDIPPSVSCDGCIQPGRAEIGGSVTIEPNVTDLESGVESWTVCTDKSCEDVVCGGPEGDSCTYSSDEPITHDVYVKATDRQGNSNTVRIGSMAFKIPIGASCGNNNECITGNCEEGICRPAKQPPSVEFNKGGG